MHRHSFGVAETVVTVVFFTAGKIFLAFPRIAMEYGGSAAWMLVLISGLAALPTLWAIRAMQARFPQKSLPEATEAVWGPTMGTAINLGYCVFFIARAFLALRQFSENIIATVLPHTPLPMVAFCFVCVAAYGVILGPEGITRICWMVTPFTAVTFFALMAGGYWTYHTVHALTPVLGYGVIPTVGNGVVYSSLFAEWLLLGLFAPHFRKQSQFRQVLRWSSILSVFIVTGTILLYELVFPWPSGARISFPLLELSRLIVSGRWVQRLESLFFLMWVIVATLSAAVSLYGAARTLADTIRLQNYRHLVFPLALTIFSLSQAAPNMTVAVAWDFFGLRIWGSLISVLLPVFTWMLAAARHKEEA